jgi:hypothetical protein
MGFLNSVISLTSARQLNELAEIVAQKSYPHVWRRVKFRVLAMTPAEARGYIRAHCAEIIRANVSALLATNESLGDWAREALIERATDDVIWLCVDEVVRQRRERHDISRAA